MTIASFKQHLRAAMPFGCAPAALLFLAMGFVVFVGNIMGDCGAEPGCHDNDGFHILNGLMWTLVITMLIGAGSWLASGGGEDGLATFDRLGCDESSSGSSVAAYHLALLQSGDGLCA
ncbi:MAG: hypothetical protein KKD64_07415 [Alphaproteobacteria bacterium]|nr:hypothetical protein [Alphaproteobacteria bacterium]MBU0793723.1 hypothetical protein [Alphaproteobacteria bacterium]MBU0876447.1 hypothetical protein [Alphaproteobacteria bacterium]MBU1769466.1 hypothetical protein [Alphaproteobacteria bacterium]